jgi:ribonucleotide monophosphatase NagD (HAD superfamily)
MVGDDIEFDILGAQKFGMKACLVKTGKFRESDLEKGIKPDLLLESVNELPKALMEPL